MKLIISFNGTDTEFVPREDLGEISIGRADTNDVAIATKSISRKHATLERSIEGWKLVDQMSANGTKVNNETVNFAFIKEGDTIQVGEATIRVTGLAPAPGANVPAAARPVPVRRAAPAGAAVPGEGRSAAAYTPPKRTPIGPAIAAGVGVLALLIGGWFIMTSGSTPAPEQTIAGETNDGPRTARLDDDESVALGLIDDIRASRDSTEERLERLSEISGQVPERRGSVARGEYSELRDLLLAQLRIEVEDRVNLTVAQSGERQQSGEYAAAIGMLADVAEWLESGTYVRSIGRPHLSKIRSELDAAHKANQGYIGGSYNQMWHLAEQLRFDEAVAVAEEMLRRAWFDAEGRQTFERERDNLIAARDNHVPEEKPEIAPEGEPARTPSILDRVKVEEDQLPGRNELLPDGERSEQRLLNALHGRMVTAASNRGLTSLEFMWRGNRTEIRGATTEALRLMVFSRDRRTNEELPPYTTTVAWEVLSAEDVMQLYDRTPNLTAEDLLAITIYAYNAGLQDEGARRAFVAYQAKPEWKGHIDNLIASKRRMPIPQGGFVEFEGMLIAPDEQEEILFRRELRVVLERFERGIGSRDRRRQQDSEAAFQEILNLGERAVPPAIEILKGVLARELKAAEESAGLTAADGRQMDELLDELDRRRAHALDLIMDEVRYPYPYAPNNAEIQADVNERVAAVRELWDNPTSFIGRTNPQYEDNITKVRTLAERMQQLDPGNNFHEGTPDEVIEYLRGQANSRLTIRTWPGRNNRYMALINYNRAAMAFNEDFPTGARHADGDSRLQVRITNEYRIMFARRALKINDKLFWASWYHSRYCSVDRGGQIAHVIPGHPYGDAPADRARREGYNGGLGENIHMHSGGPTAAGAHNGWINSSGHHRNILHPNWRVLGSAKFGVVWTQKFGAVDEGDGNMVSNGGGD